MRKRNEKRDGGIHMRKKNLKLGLVIACICMMWSAVENKVSAQEALNCYVEEMEEGTTYALEQEVNATHIGYTLPSEEEIATWEEDGTLQQRIDFMKAIEESHSPEGLITKWTQPQTFSLISPAAWTGGMPTEGDVKALVFLVEFADVKNNNPNITEKYVSEMLFGKKNEDDEKYPYESLTAYYQRSSYDKLNILGDVYGWYTLSENRNAYENDGNVKLIKELLDAYDDQIDFSDYDADADGNLDAIYIYYAGGTTGWGTSWWSYMSSLNKELNYDKTAINKYVFLGDLDNTTVIHETGHLLGLVDYYYRLDNYFVHDEMGGLGKYDMMDYNIGDHNIFSKMLLGWVEPYIVTENTEIDLKLLSSSEAKAVIVAKEDISSIFDEYYMLELYNNSGNNSQSVDRTKPLVKIYHVDATLNDEGTDFKYNNATSEHKLIKLLESDGKEMSGLTDCEILGSQFYDAGMSVGPNTIPSSEWYGGVYSGIEIIVDDFTDDKATVKINVGVEDKIGPDLQTSPLLVSCGVYNTLPIKTNSIQILFDCYIYKGDNFGGISLKNSDGDEVKIKYDILNPRMNYPQTVNRYNIIEMTIEEDLVVGKEYIINFPKDSVRDAAGNGNEEIQLTIYSSPQHTTYQEAGDELVLDILPDKVPDDIEITSRCNMDGFYMQNGNTVIAYTLTNGDGGVKVYSPEKAVVSDTYIEANIQGGEMYPLGDEYYLLAGLSGYVILRDDGTFVKAGSYTESGYNGSYKQIIAREGCFDILLYDAEYEFSSGNYICRINENQEITYLYPNNIDGNIDLRDYDANYTAWRKSINQHTEFAQKNYIEDTQYAHRSYLSFNYLDDIYVYRSLYHKSSSLCWALNRGVSTSFEICRSLSRKYVECNAFLSENNLSYTVIDYIGDGYITNTNVFDGYNDVGSQIVRYDNELNALWTIFIPADNEQNIVNNPIRIGDTIYVSQGSKLLAISDEKQEIWISSEKGFSFADTVGDLDEEKQTILVAPGTTVQSIADKVQGSYGNITFYDASYEKITDWSQIIHNGIVCITTENGFYSYYYQITDIKEIALEEDCIEIVGGYGSLDGEIFPYSYTSSSMISASEDKQFLYVESEDFGIAEGYLSSDMERGLLVVTRGNGETKLTIKNIFGDAVAECVVKVYPYGTILTTGVELETNTLNLKVGEKKELIAKILPENATDKTMHWSSSDESVVTVNETGELTAVQSGEAEIVVTTGNGKKAVCTVIVEAEPENRVSVEWGDGWNVLLDYSTVENRFLTFVTALQDGEQRTRSVEEFTMVNGMRQYDISPLLRESGQYSACGYLSIFEEEGVENLQAFTTERTYVRPEAEMPQATATWDTTDGYVLNISAVEDAAAYYVQLYKENEEQGFDSQGAEIIQANASDVISVDYTDSIRAEGKYKVSVFTISNDVDVIANSKEAVSSILDTKEYTAKVSNELAEIIANNTANEALEKVKEEYTMGSLVAAMRTDAEVVELISLLEEQYVSENDITVDTEISTEASAYVGNASIVGAGLNATEGSVTLDISLPTKEDKDEINSEYEKAVVLNLRLKNNLTELHELSMPVTITMTVPQGIDKDKMIILHYKESGREIIDFVDNGDGTVTFTTDGFSLYEFAEEGTVEENPFGDVKDSDWYHPYVMFAYKYNLMGGKGEMPDGTLKFDPANTITRAEFVQMLYAKENYPAVEYTDTFTDVSNDKWYTDAILWAAAEEIVGGKRADYFDVNGKITRQEIALILYKYALYKGYNTDELANVDLSGFTDVSTVSNWADTGMKWAVQYHVIGGKNVNGEQLLAPCGNAIRAEAATMMKAFMVAYEDIEQ